MNDDFQKMTIFCHNCCATVNAFVDSGIEWSDILRGLGWGRMKDEFEENVEVCPACLRERLERRLAALEGGGK